MPSIQQSNLTRRLLNRGDSVQIVGGRLIIESASGQDVPSDYLETHREQLMREMLEITGKNGFYYTGYSTGNYAVKGEIRKGGVTLNFVNAVNGDYAWVTYNANLTRERNSKFGEAGSPLPRGHFRVKRNNKFCKFWLSLDLSLPRRLSSFHDYMGRLKQLALSCEIDLDNNKVIDKRIARLTITVEELLLSLNNPSNCPDNSRTTDGQSTDKVRTKTTDKELLQTQRQCASERDSGACRNKCEISKQVTAYTRAKVVPLLDKDKKAKEKVTEKWLAGYGPS
jgi:hypothetical protein